MICYVYKSQKKPDTYLYITTKDEFSSVPDALTKMLGQLEYVMEFDINQKDKLGREDIEAVKNNLKEQGFHLQMPETLPDIIPEYSKH